MKRKNKYLREYRRVQYVIRKSQWRKRRLKNPKIYEHLQFLNYVPMPAWIEFDRFAGAFCMITKPQSAGYPAVFWSPRFALEKLTPWRLKI